MKPILCEQCGNEFMRGKKVKVQDNPLKIKCPYCGYLNDLPNRFKKNNR